MKSGVLHLAINMNNKLIKYKHSCGENIYDSAFCILSMAQQALSQ